MACPYCSDNSDCTFEGAASGILTCCSKLIGVALLYIWCLLYYIHDHYIIKKNDIYNRQTKIEELNRTSKLLYDLLDKEKKSDLPNMPYIIKINNQRQIVKSLNAIIRDIQHNEHYSYINILKIIYKLYQIMNPVTFYSLLS